MADPGVRYLGMELRSPLVASSSPLTGSLAGLGRLDRHGFATLDQLRGRLSQRSVPDPAAFERANHIKPSPPRLVLGQEADDVPDGAPVGQRGGVALPGYRHRRASGIRAAVSRNSSGA